MARPVSRRSTACGAGSTRSRSGASRRRCRSTASGFGALRVITLDGEGDPLIVEPNGRRPPTDAEVLLLSETADGPSGRRSREVIVDGWRFEVEVEPESRARLRERARRTAERAGHAG